MNSNTLLVAFALAVLPTAVPANDDCSTLRDMAESAAALRDSGFDRTFTTNLLSTVARENKSSTEIAAVRPIVGAAYGSPEVSKQEFMSMTYRNCLMGEKLGQ